LIQKNLVEAQRGIDDLMVKRGSKGINPKHALKRISGYSTDD
jgi:hypothetical protein